MRILEIERRHLDVSGETCNRCHETGENMMREVIRLNGALRPKGMCAGRIICDAVISMEKFLAGWS